MRCKKLRVTVALTAAIGALWLVPNTPAGVEALTRLDDWLRLVPSPPAWIGTYSQATPSPPRSRLRL